MKNFKFSLVFVLLCSHLVTFATVNVSLHIVVNDSISIEKCNLCVSDISNRVAFFAELSEKHIDFQLQQEGNYTFILTDGPIIVCNQSFVIEGDTTLTLEQEARSINLDEVVIVAQSRPQTTATGRVFKI